MKTERIESIYNELSTLVIELDADPTTKGPVYLQDLISKTRGYLNRTSLLIHEVHRERHGVERDLDAHEAAYQVSSDELLAEDARVTRLPSIDDRKAMISLILRDERMKINDLKRDLKELSFVEKAVKHRHKELDNTMSSIRMQKSLIDTEVRTGSFYGDETDTSRGTVYGKRANYAADDIDDDELTKLLDMNLTSTESDGEATDGTVGLSDEVPQDVVATVEDKPNSVSPEDDQMRRFLEGDDYADVLNNI